MADLQIMGTSGSGGITAVSAPAAVTPVEGAAAGNPGNAAPDPAGAAPKEPGAVPAPAAPPNEHKLKSAVGDANHALAVSGTQMVFVFDDHAHHMSVKLLDVQTQKVVQEMEPGAAMKAAQALSGGKPGSKPPSGALVDTTA